MHFMYSNCLDKIGSAAMHIFNGFFEIVWDHFNHVRSRPASQRAAFAEQQRFAVVDGAAVDA